MAEAIGVTASLLGIATFAFQLSKEVYDIVDSIQKAPQTIRDLKSELAALDPILSSIRTVVMSDASKFEDIRYPLHQCGMVCYHLRTLIKQCTVHSANGNRSARDWLKLQYKGKTIDGYKGQLSSYKATIGIALNLFTLTNTALTADAIEEIKAKVHEAIIQTQPDLEMHIEGITEGLDSLATEAADMADSQPPQPHGNDSLQISETRVRMLEENRLALEVEKKAMEQSQLICKTASQQLEGAPSQLHPRSIHAVFSGANNSGVQLALNSGIISNLRWGAKP